MSTDTKVNAKELSDFVNLGNRFDKELGHLNEMLEFTYLKIETLAGVEKMNSPAAEPAGKDTPAREGIVGRLKDGIDYLHKQNDKLNNITNCLGKLI